ncbi:MAG TPA: PEP-CTERM sorting domain-containing protein [Burkholderiales bacterium]|nr:PEP-CTERM sorting domain-containing protein [Burkholderiales bacterium]
MRLIASFVGVLVLVFSGVSSAGVILQATSATASSTFSGYSAAKATNQQGLTVGYVSGVTDFDTYVATATHSDPSLATGGLAWFNNGGSTSTFDMDFGAATLLQRLVLWTDVSNPNNINGFDVLLSNDPTFGSFINAGSFNATDDPNNPTIAQVFDFADASARYLRLNITSNYGGPFTGFAEAAVETSAVIPEPASLVLLGLGLFALGFSHRKKV